MATEEASTPIVLVARYRVREGAMEQVAEALRKMGALVKELEPGCLYYAAQRAHEDANLLLLYEVYQDQAALNAHSQSPYFQELVLGAIVPLLESREREFYTPLS